MEKKKHLLYDEKGNPNIALAKERGVDVSKLQGTTQNDLIKEYLARVISFRRNPVFV